MFDSVKLTLVGQLSSSRTDSKILKKSLNPSKVLLQHIRLVHFLSRSELSRHLIGATVHYLDPIWLAVTQICHSDCVLYLPACLGEYQRDVFAIRSLQWRIWSPSICLPHDLPSICLYHVPTLHLLLRVCLQTYLNITWPV